MKPFLRIFGKCKEKKHPPLSTDLIVSHLEPEPVTLTSITMVSAMPSVPTGSANVRTQVILLSCSTWPDHNYSNIFVDQTAQLGVSASVSTLAIHDIVSVVHEHDPSVSHI